MNVKFYSELGSKSSQHWQRCPDTARHTEVVWSVAHKTPKVIFHSTCLLTRLEMMLSIKSLLLVLVAQ